MEQAAQVRDVVFDKTGTLTRGRPEVVRIQSTADSQDEHRRLLLVAAAAERGSEHPLASAIVRRAGTDGLEVEDIPVTWFEAVPGVGSMRQWTATMSSSGAHGGWWNRAWPPRRLRRWSKPRR